MALAKLSNTSPMISASPNCLISTPAGRFLAAGSAITRVDGIAERRRRRRDRRRSRRGACGRSGRWRSGPGRARSAATADSGTAAPDGGRDLERLRAAAGRRARCSSSCTRIGTCRSPTSNLARLAPMSPMVAMRTASEMASVETPSSAAMSVIGTTRSSGRSSSAVETTLASSGMRLAWLVSSAADVRRRRRHRGRRRRAGTGAGRCPAGTRSGCRARRRGCGRSPRLICVLAAACACPSAPG